MAYTVQFIYLMGFIGGTFILGGCGLHREGKSLSEAMAEKKRAEAQGNRPVLIETVPTMRGSEEKKIVRRPQSTLTESAAGVNEDNLNEGGQPSYKKYAPRVDPNWDEPEALKGKIITDITSLPTDQTSDDPGHPADQNVQSDAAPPETNSSGPNETFSDPVLTGQGETVANPPIIAEDNAEISDEIDVSVTATPTEPDLNPNSLDFELPGSDNKMHVLSEPGLTGKPFLLHFYSIYCYTCYLEAEKLSLWITSDSALQSDINIIGISIGELLDDTIMWVSQLPYVLRYRIWVDADSHLFSQLSPDGSYPFILLLNREREIVATYNELPDLPQIKKDLGLKP